jgi:periplasmic protein TonB
MGGGLAGLKQPTYTDSNLKNPPPVYPPEAFRKRIEGTVVIYAEVLPSGASGQVQVAQSSGHRILDDEAVATIKKWRFTPGTQNGRTTTQWVQIPITFRIEQR